MNLQRHPANAPGDFYVAVDSCIACQAPEHEAPDLMDHALAADGCYHCFFRKQPATPEERERAIRAVWVGCCGAVRYGGKDSDILQALQRYDVTIACDYPLEKSDN
jgi:hypothetical protein